VKSFVVILRIQNSYCHADATCTPLSKRAKIGFIEPSDKSPAHVIVSTTRRSVTLRKRAHNKSPRTSGSRRGDNFAPRLQGLGPELFIWLVLISALGPVMPSRPQHSRSRQIIILALEAGCGEIRGDNARFLNRPAVAFSELNEFLKVVLSFARPQEAVRS
jgi:hypothetical protein